MRDIVSRIYGQWFYAFSTFYATFKEFIIVNEKRYEIFFMFEIFSSLVTNFINKNKKVDIKFSAHDPCRE